MITRDELDASLRALVASAQELVNRAHDAVDSGAVCAKPTSFLGVLNPANELGDDAACAALRDDVDRLDARMLDLASRVGTIQSKADRDLDQGDVQAVESYAGDIKSEAANLVDAGETSIFQAFLSDTIAKFTQFLTQAVGVVATVAADAVGAATGGFLSGLGPLGTLVVVAGLYLYFTRGRA